jgi:methylated-DNA-[protein]-cysteine S-methyltransferase
MLPAMLVEPAPGITLRLAGGDAGLRSVEFRPSGPALGSHPTLDEAARQLRAYFAGRLWHFDLPLDPQGTEFQLRVWRALLGIPYGETRSYGAVAEAIGAPKSVRAVGAANGANPIPIIVPCHRVIGAGGQLTGYGGGLPLKKTLLELEAKHAWRSRQTSPG